MSLFKKSSRATLRSALGSPATPQMVINTKGHIDRVLVRQAIINAGDHILASQSFSGGGIKDNHAIQKHDVTLGSALSDCRPAPAEPPEPEGGVLLQWLQLP
jgi:hypothetical protein